MHVSGYHDVGPTHRQGGSYCLNCAWVASSPLGSAPISAPKQRTLHLEPSMVLAKPLSRILYVDDAAAMRELVRTALAAQTDFSVVTCASGFEALIIVGQLRPDLILLDVAIAAELTQLIRSIWNRIAG